MGGVFFGGFRRADVHETFEGERREVGRVDVEDESAIILEKQGNRWNCESGYAPMTAMTSSANGGVVE